jgi:hypothetical protein
MPSDTFSFSNVFPFLDIESFIFEIKNFVFILFSHVVELIKDEIRYIQLFNKDPSAKIKSPQEVKYISNLTPERSTFSVKGIAE